MLATETAGGLQKLTIKTLPNVDFGKAALAFQRHLERAVQDCDDRPGVKKARKVSIQLSITPVPEVDGNTINCYAAKGVLTVTSKIPNHETQEIDFGVRANGDLVFNPESPGNHRQATMFVDDEE